MYWVFTKVSSDVLLKSNLMNLSISLMMEQSLKKLAVVSKENNAWTLYI